MDAPPLDYDHVLLDLLAGAPACLVEQVMRLYPDLPGRPCFSEAEVLLRRVTTPSQPVDHEAFMVRSLGPTTLSDPVERTTAQ
jgi:hypothetical protein